MAETAEGLSKYLLTVEFPLWRQKSETPIFLNRHLLQAAILSLIQSSSTLKMEFDPVFYARSISTDGKRIITIQQEKIL